MIIALEGNVNRIYVQGLCMAFFHGIKFPDDPRESTDDLLLRLRLDEGKDFFKVIAELSFGDKIAKKEKLYSLSSNETAERARKTAVGQAVYELCKQLTGKDVDWGILTGIRPSKVCAELLKSNSPAEVAKELCEKYLLSPQKAELLVRVTQNEQLVMNKADDLSCSLYISIPFCPSRCNYCSFISCAGEKMLKLIPEYLDKLIAEIKATAKLISNIGLRLSCVYVGGGTPTVLNEEQLDRLLKEICACVDASSLDEFTLEAGRPDTITEKKLELAKKYGVSRVSVNPQTLNDRVLEKIGRRHTENDFLEAFEKVERAQIGCVNTDLIAGLDGDDFESFKRTVDKIISLSPENVTVHSFCVKKSARILRDDANIYNQDDLDAKKSVDYAIDRLLASGYEPYYMYRQKNTVGNLENVGYSKKGFFGAYNVFMMADAHTVFGVGAGATTKLIKNSKGKTEILRIFSPKYPYEYLQDNQDESGRIKEFFNRR